MKRMWLAFTCVIALGSLTPALTTLAYGINRNRRQFVPQAVVVAKKKLAKIADGPPRTRRRDLLDTLEMLFADFGITHARDAANNVITGKYGFFQTLTQNDRVALAPIVADLKALFPEEMGLVALLSTHMSTLARLRTDENPTVAKRARWLIGLASGNKVEDASRTEVNAALRAFLRLGRAGLVAYRNINDGDIAQLQDRLPELERLANSENTIIAKQARMLMEVAARNEVADVPEYTAKATVQHFLGQGGFPTVRRNGESLIAKVFERLSELEIFAKDEDEVVAERARVLILFAQGKDVPRKKSTIAIMARAFLSQGRAGLVDYQRLSRSGTARLAERLSELELLAKDSNPRVAYRAKALIQAAKQEAKLGLHKNTIVQYMQAFLDRGRAGLLNFEEIGAEKIERLRTRISELEELAQDRFPTVSAWASTLIEVANGGEVDVFDAPLRSAIDAFLQGGRASLLGMPRGPGSASNRQQLKRVLPALETLTKDDNVIVAKRAAELLEFANGKKLEDSVARRLNALGGRFLKRGREALLIAPMVKETLRADLAAKLPELKALANDPYLKIAAHARSLVHVVNRDAIVATERSTLERVALAFLTSGREGLRNFASLSENLRDELAEELPELVRLSRDENPIVSTRAETLIQVALGQEVVAFGDKQLRQMAYYFKQGGRAGLLGGDAIPRKKIAQLMVRLPELDNLTKDDDPIVAEHARALVLMMDTKDVPGYPLGRLERMTDSFLAKGRAGFLEKGLVRAWMKERELPALIANERLGEVGK